MLIFVAILVAGLVLTIGGSLFGHDHDGFDHDHDHDHGHDAGHGNEPTISIFSAKVIGTFVTGFGGGGALARHVGHAMLASSISGLLVGIAMGGLMYVVLKFMYGQQSNSIVETTSLIGSHGMVTIEIGAGSVGQVMVRTGSSAPMYLARGSEGKGFPKGRAVVVTAVNGSEVVVDEAKQ